MLRKRYSALILLGALPALAGCVQAIRHSNTMVFATTTSVGIKAGASAGETPSVNIGFDRQEAVLMPLLANNSDHEKDNLLRPCKVSKIEENGQDSLLHPCKFIAAQSRDGYIVQQDSYSVLASFGAQGSGSADDGGEGSIGLAQYFATGVAAQKLAENGGLVSFLRAHSQPSWMPKRNSELLGAVCLPSSVRSQIQLSDWR